VGDNVPSVAFGLSHCSVWHRGTHRRAAERLFATVVCAGLLLAALTGCGSSKAGSTASNASSSTRAPNSVSRKATAKFGQFAGYTQAGRLSAISASWTVPKVTGGSGVAGTWIGAEAPGRPGPFIQIGTNEQRSTDSARAEYVSFWGDTTQHFEPTILFNVQPGDQIHASLRLDGPALQLSIIDATSNVESSFETEEEAHASFDSAQWLQEDVTNGKTSRRLAYPNLTPVEFRDLKVNSYAAPTYAKAQSSWMSVGAKNFAPSPLRAGSFAITPTRVSPVGAQYLRIAKAEDQVATAVGERASHWSAKTPSTRIAASLKPYEQALAANVHRLSAVQWPASVRSLIDRLIAETNTLRGRLKRASDDRNLTIRQVRTIFRRRDLGRTPIEIRRALHLPDRTY
jgi:hypothetical protein